VSDALGAEGSAPMLAAGFSSGVSTGALGADTSSSSSNLTLHNNYSAPHKEARVHRNALRNSHSRIRRFLAGEKISDRPNWQ